MDQNNDWQRTCHLAYNLRISANNMTTIHFDGRLELTNDQPTRFNRPDKKIRYLSGQVVVSPITRHQADARLVCGLGA